LDRDRGLELLRPIAAAGSKAQPIAVLMMTSLCRTLQYLPSPPPTPTNSQQECAFGEVYAAAVAAPADAVLMHIIATCLSDGIGVDANDVEAASWWHGAADLGFVLAIESLSWVCASGRGIEVDRIRLKELTTIGVALGYA
jgi:TPR repeat protein